MLPTREFFFEAIAQSVRQPLSDARHPTTEDDHFGVVQQHGGRETLRERARVLRQKVVVREQFGRGFAVILLKPVAAAKPFKASSSTTFANPRIVRDSNVPELAGVVGYATEQLPVCDDSGPNSGGHRDINEVARLVFSDGVFRERTDVSIVVNGHREIELLSGPTLKVESLPARHVDRSFHDRPLEVDRAPETHANRVDGTESVLHVSGVKPFHIREVFSRTTRWPRVENHDTVVTGNRRGALCATNVNCQAQVIAQVIAQEDPLGRLVIL